MKTRLILYLVSSLAVASCMKEQAIPVTTDFNYEVQQNDLSVPVRVHFTNATSGAKNYQWTFEGGMPATSDKKEPGMITFDQAGTHKIILEAWNDDHRDRKEILLQLDSAVTMDFTATMEGNAFSPATVNITNQTTGASTYLWTFENGVPATATAKHPRPVVFTMPGEHKITLQVSNGREAFTLTKKIVVAASLDPDFDIVPSFEDEDYEAPLTATLNNKTTSGLIWQWSATGGTIAHHTAASPDITFTSPGTYSITLTADNTKETKQVSKTITVLPNKNLRSFSNIHLGINSAHSTIGSFFSTKLRRSFSSADNLDVVGSSIDIVFFGLSSNFTYNKFISPDSASYYTFPAIPQAMKIKMINAQEQCNCGVAFSAADFDNMTTDAPLQSISIPPGVEGWKQFTDAIVPRVIVFETQDGRKGAIKVKQFVQSGNQSYVIVDIKVQKTP